MAQKTPSPKPDHREATMLNVLWLSFFFLASASALWRWLVMGDPAVFSVALMQRLR